MLEYKLLCCVVNHQKGSKVLRIASKYSVHGGTILLGKGTVESRILEMLDLNDSRKELVLIVAKNEMADKCAESIAKEMSFHKQGHGIAFTVPIKTVIASESPDAQNKSANTNQSLPNKKEESPMFHSIFTIVEKGFAEDVIDAAAGAGAKGGTIINARGSGSETIETLFGMQVEPEKEIVMILSSSEYTESIASAIREKFQIDSPNRGIIFILEVNKTYGLLPQ